MKPPVIPQFRDIRFSRSRAPHGERGVTMVLVAVAMVAIIGIAAWSIDLVTLYLAREEAQRAADAAALTAARIISVSGITGNVQPSLDTANWQAICGANGAATQAAKAAGGQNSVGSQAANVTVKYATGDGSNATTDCSSFNQVFAVNPMVVVQVQRTNLPGFFSRLWGNTGNTISATAIAEAFNPSASDVNTNGGATGAVTPVQPRCVKPWIVPNQNPLYGSTCSAGAGCDPWVTTANGTIQHAGISTGATVTGVIGETFTLFADCPAGPGACNPPPDSPPVANTKNSNFNTVPPPNLEYLPGQAPSSAVAVPSCGNASDYEAAVAGCDQSTAYQCGVSKSSASPPNAVELTENPSGPNGDTALGLACSLTSQTSVPLANQDVLDTTAYPYKIRAGTANPLKIPSTTQITASNQIVSLPIYDSSTGQPFIGGAPIPVTIVGFLQVFINSIDANGNISVTVLNVAGCGNGSGTTPNNAVNGSSPVPVRLITPP